MEILKNDQNINRWVDIKCFSWDILMGLLDERYCDTAFLLLGLTIRGLIEALVES